jgi:hypothetical protein
LFSYFCVVGHTCGLLVSSSLPFGALSPPPPHGKEDGGGRKPPQM